MFVKTFKKNDLLLGLRQFLNKLNGKTMNYFATIRKIKIININLYLKEMFDPFNKKYIIFGKNLSIFGFNYQEDN